MTRPRLRLSVPARVVAGLTLALHLFLVGVGAAVDARLEAESIAFAGALDHIEDRDAGDCGSRHHDHRYCLICRSLDAIDLPPLTSSVGTRIGLLVPVRAGSEVAPLRTPVRSGLGARAPPLT